MMVYAKRLRERTLGCIKYHGHQFRLRWISQFERIGWLKAVELDSPMMETAITKNGTTITYDLNKSFDLVCGYSQVKPGWGAVITFLPDERVFVEFRCNNVKDEVNEVDEQYIRNVFGLSTFDLERFKADPEVWQCVGQLLTS